jgi:hypothetical protein
MADGTNKDEAWAERMDRWETGKRVIQEEEDYLQHLFFSFSSMLRGTHTPSSAQRIDEGGRISFIQSGKAACPEASLNHFERRWQLESSSGWTRRSVRFGVPSGEVSVERGSRSLLLSSGGLSSPLVMLSAHRAADGRG